MLYMPENWCVGLLIETLLEDPVTLFIVLRNDIMLLPSPFWRLVVKETETCRAVCLLMNYSSGLRPRCEGSSRGPVDYYTAEKSEGCGE
jgi:hypothetical protein